SQRSPRRTWLFSGKSPRQHQPERRLCRRSIERNLKGVVLGHACLHSRTDVLVPSRSPNLVPLSRINTSSTPVHLSPLATVRAQSPGRGRKEWKIVRVAVPAAAVSDTAQVVGRITLVGITTGEPILPTRLAGPNGVAFVVIPSEALGANGAPNPGSPNYRAMSITVADAQAAGGAILPGDIVDVLYTLTFAPDKLLINPNPQRNSSDVSARIVLERVPILARTLSVYVIRTDAATAERIGYLTASGGSISFL